MARQDNSCVGSDEPHSSLYLSYQLAGTGDIEAREHHRKRCRETKRRRWWAANVEQLLCHPLTFTLPASTPVKYTRTQARACRAFYSIYSENIALQIYMVGGRYLFLERTQAGPNQLSLSCQFSAPAVLPSVCLSVLHRSPLLILILRGQHTIL